MGVGPSPRKTQPRTLIRSRFADAGMRRPAVGRFPKAEAGVRAASGRHARAYVFPRPLLYAFPRLRVLSIESAGAGATMEPRPAERSCQFAQPAEGGGETAEQAVVVLDVIHPGIDLEV